MDPLAAQKGQIPISVLMDSRTVVEKKDYVSTGILTYIEGDLIEIEIGDYKAFALGDSVRITIYSPAGVFTFASSVIALDEGSIIILNPPENYKKFIDRREHPRVEADCAGEILSASSPLSGKNIVFPKAVIVGIRNISLGGLGFFLPQSNMDIFADAIVNMQVDINGILPCVGQIVRMDQLEDGHLYGAKFVEIHPNRLNLLRAFILRVQVQTRIKGKKQPEGAIPPRKFK